MNQDKLDVVKQEMARVNTNISGISKLKWTGMGEFNSDDHYIYYCGQESLRRNQMLFPEIEKAFLSDQCKEIEENNKMGKTRDLFKKIRGIKRTFHTRMGMIKSEMVRTHQKQKKLRRGSKKTQENYIERS